MSEVCCPHCALPLAEGARIPFPPGPMRCPNCQLVVAAGRGRLAEDLPASSGSAVGVLSAAARRANADSPAEALDPKVIADALQDAARTLEVRIERLRMIDYQRIADERGLPNLASVVEGSSWKQVRRMAADRIRG